MAENGTVRKLNLTFATDADTTFRLSVANPIENPDAEEVMLSMESMAMKGVLMDSKGNEAIGAYAAQVVTTTTELLF